MNIYALLTSKPHNRHHLSRYCRFILACQKYNQEHNILRRSKSNPTGIYMEDHHICPKARDLFPEYASFKMFSWNKATLTSRQHFIAHIMLAKAFGGSQSRAIVCMISRLARRNVDNIKITSILYERFKQDQAIDNSLRNSGDGHWSRQPGQVHNFKINHPRGFKNKSHSEKTRAIMSEKQTGDLNHFKGKHHSDQTKATVSQKRKARIWITDGNVDKQNYKHLPMPDGFKPGRLSGTMSSRIWITNGYTDTHLTKGRPMPDGFRPGRTNMPMNKC